MARDVAAWSVAWNGDGIFTSRGMCSTAPAQKEADDRNAWFADRPGSPKPYKPRLTWFPSGPALSRALPHYTPAIRHSRLRGVSLADIGRAAHHVSALEGEAVTEHPHRPPRGAVPCRGRA